jgi:hypothetical protein
MRVLNEQLLAIDKTNDHLRWSRGRLQHQK